jgi:hypothetical protein
MIGHTLITINKLAIVIGQSVTFKIHLVYIAQYLLFLSERGKDLTLNLDVMNGDIISSIEHH